MQQTIIKILKFLNYCILIMLAAIIFLGCSGGGGGSGSSPQDPSGNWDEMTWDQGRWT